MTPTRITFLLPGHGWEELASVDHEETALAISRGFTALWHPQIIAAAGGSPRLQPIHDLDRTIRGELVVVSPFADAYTDVLQLDENENVIVELSHPVPPREQLASRVREQLDLSGPDVGADEFFAIGYAYLQMKLLTYRVHYSSGLDEEAFSNRVTEAAISMVRGEPTDKLAAAYRMLRTEKHNYYPVDSYLLDLVLWSDAAPAELPDPPISLMITGEALMGLNAEIHQKLRAAEESQVCLVGGEWAEPPLALMSSESILTSLRLGQATFQQVTGSPPRYFARRRFGITPMLVQALASLGYEGIVQSTLDGTACQTSVQPRSRWVLPDGQAMPALGKVPMAAHDPIALLNIGTAMGGSMELDHLATLTLARWAHEPPLDSLSDLCRSSAASPYLGQMVTLAGFFSAECHQIRDDSFPTGRLVSQHLQAAPASDAFQPVSYWVQLHLAESLLEQAMVMNALDAVLRRQGGSASTKLLETQRQLVATNAAVEEAVAQTGALHAEIAEQLGETLTQATTVGAGLLLINPRGFDRNIHFNSEHQLVRPDAALAWHHDESGTEGVVRVPGCGYVFMEFDEHAPPVTSSRALGEDHVFANQYLSVHVHPDHGGIRAVYDLRTRGNRASQRLGKRTSHDRNTSIECELESVQLTHSTSVSATCVAEGKLVVNGQPEIGFAQSLSLVAAQRRVGIDLTLEPAREPIAGSPWGNYLCSTLALPDDAELFRGLNGQRHKVEVDRVESTSYLDWVTADRKTTLLPGGLPFHRRHDRFVDTILRAGDERACQFRLAIAIDAANPLREALDFETPVVLVPVERRPSTSRGWLVHVDAIHAMITAIEARQDDAGVAVGLVVRLLETAGRGGLVTLQTFRPLTAGRKIRFDGTPLVDCEVVDDGVGVHLRPHEWTEVELHW